MAGDKTQNSEPAVPGAVPSPMGDPSHKLNSMVDVREPLRRLRRRLIGRAVFQEAALLIVGALAVLLAAGAIDFLLRFPSAIRQVFFVAGCAVVGWAIARHLLPAIRFRPSLTSVALRVESQSPEVHGRLASAIDFAGSETLKKSDLLEQDLARVVIDHVARDVDGVDLRRAIRHDITHRRTGELLLAVVAVVMLIGLSPAMTKIGAQRLLLPWTGAEWPKRTGVMNLTAEAVHPRGEAMAMRALLTRSERSAERTEVAVQFRVLIDGHPQVMRREILALQGSEVTIDDSKAQGHLFERLIEPEGDAIEYRFLTADDKTEWRTLQFVDPPVVQHAMVTITPPEYAAALPGTAEAQEHALIDLGPGVDDRAIAPTALQGAFVALTLELNKPAELPELMQQLLSSDASAVVERLDDGQRYQANFELTVDLRLRIEATDGYGIHSPDPAVYIFSATADRAPAATIIDPTSDIEVLASAVVDVAAEARDDVALSFLALHQQVFVPAGVEPSGPGGALVAQGDAIEIIRHKSASTRTENIQATLDLGQLELAPGDEVRLTALASDILMTSQELPAVSSSPRIIRIISEQTLVDSIRGELAELRQASIRVEGQQGDLETRRDDGALLHELRRGQGHVSERVERQRANAESIQDRVEQNRLNDPGLNELLDGVGKALEEAANASSRAEETLERAQQAATAEGRNPEVATEEESQATAAEQAQVREALARVAEMLDRGEDAWVIQNTLNRLLRDQRDLREATASAGAASAGQRPEDLSEAKRREMERLAEAQRQLAERTDEAVQELRERAEEMKSMDPATAAGLQQAAASAKEQRVAQTMREAAEATEQNQTASAGQSQDEAIEALEEVLEQLEAGERRREQVLKRLLASVIESIDQLIAQQEEELVAIEEAQANAPALLGLDTGMIRLNQNTLGVADMVRGTGPELAQVLSAVSKASDAQVAAIRGLRKTPIDAGAVKGHEQRSLEMLRDAASRAKEAEEQLEEQEQDRKEREIKAAYTALLRQVTRLAETTSEFALADRLTRRDRAQLRELAGEHDAMVERLDELEQDIEEIAAAAVFAHAHKRAKTLAQHGADQLRDAEAMSALASQRAMARVLRDLVDALSDPPPDDDPFSEGPQGGGNGSGQGGPPELLPPPKELRLLRLLQIDLAERTVNADGLQGEVRATAIKDVATEQGELSQLGTGVIQKLQGGAPAGMPAPQLLPDDAGDAPADEQPEPAIGEGEAG